MTDARLGGPSARRRLPIGLLLAVGILAIVGGVAASVVAKVTADHAQFEGSSTTAVLAVGVSNGYLFPAPAPDYTGVWIGVTVAAIGATVLIIGLVAASRARCPA